MMRQRTVGSVVAGIMVPGGGQLVAGREARGLAVWFVVFGLVVAGAYLGAAGNARGFYAAIAIALLVDFVAVIDAALTTRGPLRSIVATIALVAVALTASWCVQLVLRRQVMELFKLPSSSMAPTLLSGDHIAVDKRARTPSRGDVVVFRHGGVDFVKRVIAVGGDRIAFSDGIPILNGLPVAETPNGIRTVEGLDLRVLEEPLDGHTYQILRSTEPPRDTPEVLVTPGEIYVVGDNRRDSRPFGAVKLADVKGTVRFVWLGLTTDRAGVEVR